MQSFSQLGQDVTILSSLNGKRNGFFVEVGAFDGIQLSNTYLMEKQFGWNGLCVEPLINEYNKCKVNRSCHVTNYAAYSENDKVLSFYINEFLSGVFDDIDKHIPQTVDQNKFVSVTTKTLTFLLDEINAPLRIDYLSLDTEGSELEILKGIDFDKYTFSYIDIEHNYVEPRRSEMKKYLEERGYIYLGENNWDDRFGYKDVKNV